MSHTAPNGEYVPTPFEPFAVADISQYQQALDDAIAEIVAYERDYIAGRIPLPLYLQQIPAEGTE